ncbi:MAG TPA: flagellar basal body rod protein FlgC [Rhodocyclaceae bacterium]|nr:flagellar basal body rod protein FlgC [Rhodocyclaceae bacterium]
MDYLNSFAISSSGMSLERLRLDVASLNIANANVSYGPNVAPLRPLQVLVQGVYAPKFSALFDGQASGLGTVDASVVEVTNAEPRSVVDPTNPNADAKGIVRYPGVNVANEMVSLIKAVRGYEANMVAFNAAKVMAQKAIDMGGGR